MKNQTMENRCEVPMSGVSPSIFARRLAAGVLLVNFFLVALVCLSLRQSKIQYEERAAVTTRNLARMLEQNIDGSIDKIDLALLAAAEEFEHQFARGKVNRGELKKFLTTLATHLPEVDHLSAADSRGEIIFGAEKTVDPPVSIEERDYFRHLRDNPDSGLFINRPLVCRAIGKQSIVLARRINHADGSFAGVVYGVLPVEHFHKIFSSIQVGPRGVVTLRTNEPGIIARLPDSGATGSRKAADGVRDLLRRGEKSGTFKTRSPIDNFERAYSFRRLSKYPFNIVVGLATEDYLSEWRSEGGKMSAASLLYFLITIITSVGIFRYWQRRNAAVRELVLTRLCLDNAAIGIFNAGEDGTIRSVNDYACRSLGYTKEELLALNILDIDPAITPGKAAEIKSALDASGYTTHESVHKRKDGTTYPVEITTSNVHFDGNVYPFSFVRDITERKRAEQALRITQFSIDHASVPIFWIREGSRFCYTNQACRYLGYSREELLEMTSFDIAPEFTPEKAASLYKELRENGSAIFEDVHKSKGGELIPVEITLNYCEYENMEFHVAYVRNMSERKRAEAEIARSGQKFRAIFENAYDVIFIISNDFVFVDCNPAAMKLFACEKEDIIGSSPHHFSPPTQPDGLDTREKARIIISDAFEGKPQSFEWRHRRPGGDEFDVMVSINRLELEGDPLLVAIVRDISERKKMEDALRLSTSRFRELSDMLPEVNFECDLDGKLTYVNKDAFPKYGYTEQDLDGGIYLSQLLIPEERGRLREAMETKLAGRDMKPVGVQYTTVRKDGTAIPTIIYSKAIFHNEAPVGLRGIMVDISERIHLETQLYHAQKMEAVGQLAGGVAHDFNNILTAMIGFVHLILMKMSDDDPSRNYVKQISILTERATELTQGLLAYSRKQIMMPSPVDLNRIIIEQRKMLKRLVRENIELRLETSPAKLVALADRGKIEQALMNLVANARDAITAGGTITIKTSTFDMTGQFVNAHGFGEIGVYACISVSDTGCGMNEETKKKIFEPFFTTKEVGKGTGLGLSIVYGIIKQHNGYIYAYSEEEKGTTFNICLPLAEQPEEPAASRPGSPALLRGSETLLLAEDDHTLNDLHRELLEFAGYTVITASDGEEAVEKIKAPGNRLDLLILDAVMPKFNGKQVLESARTVRPGISALFVSGYPAEVLHDADILQKGVELLMKPLTPEELLMKIREMLDRRFRA